MFNIFSIYSSINIITIIISLLIEKWHA